MGEPNWRQCLGIGFNFFPLWWQWGLERWVEMYVLRVGPLTFTLSIPNRT